MRVFGGERRASPPVIAGAVVADGEASDAGIMTYGPLVTALVPSPSSLNVRDGNCAADKPRKFIPRCKHRARKNRQALLPWKLRRMVVESYVRKLA